MPYHIMLADDDANLCTVFARIIQRVYPTATIAVVADGPTALNVFRQQGADLVLTDYHMPHMDGLTLIRALRAHNAMLPIIAMSSTPSAQAEIIAAGATLFLTKLDAVNQLEAILPTLLPPQP